MEYEKLLMKEIYALKQNLSAEYRKHQSLQNPKLLEISQTLDQKINEYLKLAARPEQQTFSQKDKLMPVFE